MTQLLTVMQPLETWAREQERIGRNLLERLDKSEKLCYAIKYGIVGNKDTKRFPNSDSKLEAIRNLLAAECPHGSNNSYE
jgi:hypothetical protein